MKESNDNIDNEQTEDSKDKNIEENPIEKYDKQQLTKFIQNYFYKNMKRLETRSNTQRSIIRNMMLEMSNLIKTFEYITSPEEIPEPQLIDVPEFFSPSPRKRRNISTNNNLNSSSSKQRSISVHSREKEKRLNITDKKPMATQRKGAFYLPKVAIELGASDNNNIKTSIEIEGPSSRFNTTSSRYNVSSIKNRYMQTKRRNLSIKNILNQSFKNSLNFSTSLRNESMNQTNRLTMTCKGGTSRAKMSLKKKNNITKFLESKKNEKIIITLSKFFNSKEFPFRSVSVVCRKIYLKNLQKILQKQIDLIKDESLTSIMEKEVLKDKLNTLTEFSSKLV